MDEKGKTGTFLFRQSVLAEMVQPYFGFCGIESIYGRFRGAKKGIGSIGPGKHRSTSDTLAVPKGDF